MQKNSVYFLTGGNERGLQMRNLIVQDLCQPRKKPSAECLRHLFNEGMSDAERDKRSSKLWQRIYDCITNKVRRYVRQTMCIASRFTHDNH
jgi:hypothetical protein